MNKKTDDVIFSRKPDTWDDFFTLLKEIENPEEFIADRGDLQPQDRDIFMS